MEYDDVGEIRRRGFEHSGRRLLAVDLAIAFVGEDQEAEAPRQPDQAGQVGAVGDGALRIRRRSEIDGDRAREEIVLQRIEIGQEAGRRGRRQIDRLALGGDGAGRVGGIKRIGNEHRRPTGARAHPALGGERGEKKPLARAVEHQDFRRRIDPARERIAAVEPFSHGLGERLDALVHRVAAELLDMRRDHRADERRNRMLRLAHRHADRRLSGRERRRGARAAARKASARRPPARERAKEEPGGSFCTS